MTAVAQQHVRELTREEGHELLDRQARRLGMTADEFIAAYEAGEFDGTDDATVLDVAMFLPFGR